MPTPLVDFHCHLDLYSDFPRVVSECERKGIYTLAVTTTPRAWGGNSIATSHTKYVKSALGLHPQLIAQHHQEIELWEALLGETRYIGEVGLDGRSNYLPTIELQQRVFTRILTACEHAGNKILTIHSVRAVSKVLDMVQELTTPERTKFVLHWFTGSKAELRRAIEMGAYFSVNPRMFDNDRSLSLVANFPMDRILTETDGPFASEGGKALRPVDVSFGLDRLSTLFQKSRDGMAQQILNNLRNLLQTGGYF